jgi:hypothetical protein
MTNYERFIQEVHQNNIDKMYEVLNESINNICSNTSSSNDEEFEQMNNDLDSLLED